MSRLILFSLVLFLSFTKKTSAQENIVQGISPNLHIQHKVAAKETWYSLSRSYNLSPKELASYNKLSISHPLEIGSEINIPLTSANFTQTEQKKSGEMPLYHVVQPKEWLYRISVNHNKVPISLLEKWNGITNGDAKPGMKLIVGYLNAKGTPAASSNTAAVYDNKPDKPSQDAPAKPAEKTAPVKTADAAPQNDNAGSYEEKNNTAGGEVRQSSASKNGFFSTAYSNSGKNTSAVTGIFKSTSGWNDGKYYALMNNVPVGTIVYVTFPATNKSVYAKVLGELPEMKENAGLSLRISDAAANILGATESKFSVDVKY